VLTVGGRLTEDEERQLEFFLAQRTRVTAITAEQ
jgi:hypothetical protein